MKPCLVVTIILFEAALLLRPLWNIMIEILIELLSTVCTLASLGCLAYLSPV